MAALSDANLFQSRFLHCTAAQHVNLRIVSHPRVRQSWNFWDVRCVHHLERRELSLLGF